MDTIKQQIKDVIKTGDFGQYLPEFLFHATFSNTLDSIKKNGLGSLKSGYKSLWHLQYDQGVFLDTDAGSAEAFVEGSDDDRLETEEVIVFKIPTAKLDHSLLEIDWNNTWNTDIIEDGDLTSLEQYFNSITYFYNGVIPFADLMVVKDLNEEQEEQGIEAISPTKENIIKLLEDSSEEFLITTSFSEINTGDDFYILPDGRMVVTNLYDEDTMKIYRDHSFVDKFLAGVGMTEKPTEDRSLFFEKVTGSVAIDDGTNHIVIMLNSAPLTPAQYKTLETYIVKSDSDKDFVVIEDGKMFKDFHINSQTDRIVDEAKTIINVIKEYYITRKMEGSRMMEANDVELETIPATKENVLNILRSSDEYFKITPHTFDIQAGEDFYILPDGNFLTNIVYTNDGTKRETIDHSFVDKFLADAGMTVPPVTTGSTFFEEVTNSIAINDGYNFTGINLGKVEPTEEQYKKLQSYLSKLDYKEARVIVDNKKKGVVFTLKDSGRDELSKDAAHIINSIKHYYNTGKLSEDVDLEAITLTDKNIIDAVKEEFGFSEDIPEGTPSYLLPDGSFIDMFSESEASERSYLSSHYGWSHAQVDMFLKHTGLIPSTSSEDLSITFEALTGSIAVIWSPYEGDAFIFFNNNTPTSQQYEKILQIINNVIKQELKIYTPKLGKIDSSQLENKSAKEILDLIKQYYSTGKLGESIIKEDIDHREVYKSLTFSDNPERGPIFISREGKFVNVGRFVTHAKIFDGQDYEGDDYYVLHDAFDLIKANGGNRFEPFAYIDLWKVPNPAQKKAIISWMYYLIEWGIYELMVNTSSSNETYNLTTKIPEDTYDDITRGLLESKNESVGYRNDDYFGDGQRSLLKVVVHETTELGNIDIPDTVLKTFKHTEEQGKLLKEFIELIDSGEAIEDFDIYIETLMDVIHGEYPEAKYALWLCKTKDDVKQHYGGTDSNIGTYKIEYPKPISNLGEEGLLYVFSKLPERING